MTQATANKKEYNFLTVMTQQPFTKHYPTSQWIYTNVQKVANSRKLGVSPKNLTGEANSAHPGILAGGEGLAANPKTIPSSQPFWIRAL